MARVPPAPTRKAEKGAPEGAPELDNCTRQARPEACSALSNHRLQPISLSYRQTITGTSAMWSGPLGAAWGTIWGIQTCGAAAGQTQPCQRQGNRPGVAPGPGMPRHAPQTVRGAALAGGNGPVGNPSGPGV
jgi:hypothetical protein